jgi:cytosine/adenosine deaminase-related metal-dependent hydrolase
MTAPASWSLTARWIIPIEGTPLPGGAVVITGERITAVEPAGRLRADLDLGNAAVLPGFVNAHTHLDLTGLAGQCPPSPDFTAWLRGVVRHRRRRSHAEVEEDIRAGLAQSIQNGTTLLGDISAGGASWPILAEAPGRALVYYELLGLTEQRADQAWQQATVWLKSHPATLSCRPGLSPHAPYSVRASLFARVAELPPEVPVAIHVAETRDELHLLEHHSGPFADFLREVGVWDPAGLLPDIDALLTTFEHRRPLLVHGNYLNPDNPLLQGKPVVYCPRTHAAFGHPQHPWEQLARRQVPVLLGTDSLASNPGLDLLGELRFLHQQFRRWPGWFLLHRATLLGAQILGWGAETGSLVAGKSADLVVVPLTTAELADPHTLVLESPFPVQKVLCRGSWIWESTEETR